MTTRNILFVTIDCWRYDAPEQMPRFRNLTTEWSCGEVMCAGAATNGVFPALLASRDAPATYEDDGSLRESVRALPDVLGDAGYQTAGFAASNPFLGKWSRRFDTFWNDEMTADGVTANRDEYTKLDKIRSLLFLRSRVVAEDVFQRATEWWENTSGPRFCWVHLMEPHAPYYPGLRRGLTDGLLRSYLSIVGYSSLREDVPEWMRRQLRRLHFSCVEYLDEMFSRWLSSFDDPLIVVTGDHGEEFDHGLYGHSRLYEEVVRVPLYATDERVVSPGEYVRQQAVPSRICSSVGVTPPDDWASADESDPVQCMLSKSENQRSIYVGARTTDEKLVRTYDWEGNLTNTEVFDLRRDPEEVDPQSTPSQRLEDALDAFLGRDDVEENIDHGKRTGIDDEVSQRLSELGYTE